MYREIFVFVGTVKYCKSIKYNNRRKKIEIRNVLEYFYRKKLSVNKYYHAVKIINNTALKDKFYCYKK